MNTEPIYTFARWQVKDGALPTVLKLLAEVAANTRAEKGNLFYSVHQSISDEKTLLLYEGYTSETAVQEHRNAGYFQRIVADQIVPLLENREVILAKQLEMNQQQ